MSINISDLKKLPGDASRNFENLCRGIVKLQWGAHGEFKAYKNQPGVEFHLKLTSDCDVLGSPPKWYGWQCKNFELNANGTLKPASKRDIEDSLSKSSTIKGLTDWVLWTPFTLAKADQDWFYALKDKYPYILYLWNEQDLENLLSGPALHLRATYFGELVLTPELLKIRHTDAVAPIRERWLSPAHQEVAAESEIKKMLGGPQAWTEMQSLGDSLKQAAERIKAGIPGDIDNRKLVEDFVDVCERLSEMLLNFHQLLLDGDIDLIKEWLAEREFLITRKIALVPSYLRKRNFPIALDATNALDDMRNTHQALAEIQDDLSVGIVALLADAGGGKTQMSAELTSEQAERPAGIFLRGINFKKGQNINDLSKPYDIDGKPVTSFENLLAALDAAAKRSKCRLPLIIDGLNEAEAPKEWKAILAAIQEMVRRYPNVLIVCTLRTGEHKRDGWSAYESQTRETFAVQSLPDNMLQIQCEGFGESTIEAVRKYFKYYNIKNEFGMEVPTEFLSHPLNLRIFCEVTNSKRVAPVEITYFPASLSQLFERYVENACKRMFELTQLSLQELNDIIYKLGITFWDTGAREIDDAEFRKEIKDDTKPWDSSVINLLAQQGLIFRNPGDEPDKYVITPVYDALGGHIIASALLRKHNQDRDFSWFSQPQVISAMEGAESHPFSRDIFRSLIALTPAKIRGQQLWKVVPEDFKSSALLLTSELNAEHLDDDSVEALSQLFNNTPDTRQKLLHRLWLTKGADKHPLNADFSYRLLSALSVSDRDLSWTEWLRRERGDIFKDITRLQKRWKEEANKRSEGDKLRFKWIIWCLTSTDHNLRDDTTKALYWYGRGDPAGLFAETIKSLSINDPYVPERMLAASYGVAMSLSVQLVGNAGFTNGILTNFASEVYQNIFAADAKYRTTHQLMRDFAANIISLAQVKNPGFFSAQDLARCAAPFPKENFRQWGEKYQDKDMLDQRGKVGKLVGKFKRYLNKAKKALPKKWLPTVTPSRSIDQSPFRMDFENYTLGRLVPERWNYDYNNPEYRKVKARILWRVYELGWHPERYKKVEDNIMSYPASYRRMDEDEDRTDRYGKKYSWIAYYEMVGELKDKGILSNDDPWRAYSENIDPSFSDISDTEIFIKDNFLNDESIGTVEWIKNGALPQLAKHLEREELLGAKGKWTVLDGFYEQENKALNRRTFAFVRGFLVNATDKQKILDRLDEGTLVGHHIASKPEFREVYLAEVPWNDIFPADDHCDLSFPVGEREIITQEPNVELISDEQGFRLVTHDGTKEVRRVEPIYESYPAKLPVCEICKNVPKGGEGTLDVLSKYLAQELGLIGQPQSSDLYTSSGEKVTCWLSHVDKSARNNQKFLYIKKDALDKVLNKNGLSLIWIIWGERSGSYARLKNELEGEEIPNPSYVQFTFGQAPNS